MDRLREREIVEREMQTSLWGGESGKGKMRGCCNIMDEREREEQWGAEGYGGF